MTLTTTEPNLSQETELGGVKAQYEELKKVFQRLTAENTTDSLILTTPWAHFLQYLPNNSSTYTRLTRNLRFNEACASNPYMPLDVARLYFSTSLTSKKLLSDRRSGTYVVILGENPHIRLVWLALKANLNKDPLPNMISIIRLGYTPEDVLLDMYELLSPDRKQELVVNAVANATCNIPATFLDYLGSIDPKSFESTHIKRSLKMLGGFETKHNYKVYQRLAFGAQLNSYVSKVIDDYQSIKRSEPIRPDAGSNTSQSGPWICTGEPIPANNTGVSSASDSAIPPLVAEAA
jgi:hypothetical protein